MPRALAAARRMPVSGSRLTADSRPERPGPGDGDVVPPAAEVGDDGVPEAGLDDDLAGRRCRAGRTTTGSAVVCQAGASIAACRSSPSTTWAQPEAQLPLLLLVAAGGAEGQGGDAVAQRQRRRERGARAACRGPASWAGRARARTSGRGCRAGSRGPGSTGELCSQPPDGVAETRLPQRSTTSTWQVSPRVVPLRVDRGLTDARRRGRGGAGRRPAVTKAGSRGGRPPGEPGRRAVLAVSPMSARRSAA